MGAGASRKYTVHSSSKEELVEILKEMSQEERDMIAVALEHAERPHTDYGWSEMIHRWEDDEHGNPEIEEEEDAAHDDEHWTIMDTFKLQKLFHSMDVNGNGTVCKEEWEKAHKAHGPELRETFGKTVEDIEKLFTTIDTDGDGTLSWDEFLKAAPCFKDDS
jgi:hypothetical protein